MKELTKLWDKKATKSHKHFSKHVKGYKLKEFQDRFQKHVLNQLNFSKINTALDWGCGGGILAKEMSKHCQVTLADLSKESLDEAIRYIGKPLKQIVVSDNWNELAKINVDLILCYDVIHHFPSIAYWKQVASTWNKIGPKFIAARIKVKPKISENKDYFEGRNYLDGLFLNKKEIQEAFPGYSITYWTDDITKISRRQVAQLILTKK